MLDLIEKLQKYLQETLGVVISILPWEKQTKLPFFLTDTYAFFQTSLFNQRCLLMVLKEDEEFTPNTIQKQWEHITNKWPHPCIYIADRISSYSRKRLIQLHIPFIIPDNQIYIPDIGINLQEHFKQQRIMRKLFSPAAQVVILYSLLRETNEPLIPSKLAVSLGYSFMTMTRVFNELEAAGIGKITTKGKERWWIYEGTKRDLWEQTKGMLRSPIMRREPMKLFRPKDKMPETLSGISALAETTMINPPKIPVYAMGVEEYKTSKALGLQHSPKDEAELELEIWHYDPKLLSKQRTADPFSLLFEFKRN